MREPPKVHSTKLSSATTGSGQDNALKQHQTTNTILATPLRGRLLVQYNLVR